MKNLKNMAAATGLAAILMMSATSAQAGLLMSDRSQAGLLMSDRATASNTVQCTEDTGLYARLKGIIVVGIAGLLMSDAPSKVTGCQQDNSLMRTGLLMSD